jgi:hypothetical protein
MRAIRSDRLKYLRLAAEAAENGPGWQTWISADGFRFAEATARHQEDQSSNACRPKDATSKGRWISTKPEQHPAN